MTIDPLFAHEVLGCKVVHAVNFSEKWICACPGSPHWFGNTNEVHHYSEDRAYLFEILLLNRLQVVQTGNMVDVFAEEDPDEWWHSVEDLTNTNNLGQAILAWVISRKRAHRPFVLPRRKSTWR